MAKVIVGHALSVLSLLTKNKDKLNSPKLFKNYEH